ncbi:alginate O-acetyltransferase AlgX-related protein [Hymenobacter volaticus]|uniref:AlgX/AlgJ SGNH hydrolase-like domain-containing protein n=1 Tax=Hymenobacter volaticus TaxID=2932254 RepID=A0ABY4G5C8_9BACT|nr:hypothetical protein [Hymenobacter volaticus]UOQ66018.1 hypothetical protein MUN86_21300 [Hymenobacter volaticus]
MASLFSRFAKQFFLAVLLGLLILPAVQARFPLFEIGELGGYFERAPHPDFTWPSLLDNSYQPNLERYVEDRIGFRELLIRIRNQAAYSLLRVSKANKVLVGDDEVLLDETAIRAYLGQNFRGENVIRTDVAKFKAVQDSLARRGVLLIFAIAPDKANFYADKFPTYFKHLPRGESNYVAYAREMKSRGVNVIDLAQAFRQWKDTASYPLFPRGGIHWSGYGITLAADTLFRYIEQRGHIDLPDYSVDRVDISDKLRDSDNDVARAMNLLYEPTPYNMAYPNVVFQDPKPGQEKTDLLLVADSFGWGLIGFYPYLPKLFKEDFQFWYYNQAVAKGNPTEPGGAPVDRPVDRKTEMLNHRVIIVMYTQHNLGGFDGGFTAEAYNLLCPYSAADSSRIQAIKQELKQSVIIQDQLWEKANTTNQSYDQLLHEMAVSQFELSKLQ